MAIYQQKESEYWWLSIYRGPGYPRLRVSSGTKDYTQAKAIEGTLKSAQNNPETTDKLHEAIDALAEKPAPERLSLYAAWDVYINLPQVNIKQETARKQKLDYERLCTFTRKMFPRIEAINDVTRDVASAFLDDLYPSVRGKTYNNVKGNLGTIWQALMYRAGLEENVWRVMPNADTSDSKRGRAFSHDEVRAVLNAAYEFGHDWYGVSLVGLYTGLRYGDIVSLTWPEVEQEHLRLAPSKTQRHGVQVVIPLHAEVQRYLNKKPREDEYVFPYHWHCYRSSKRRGEFGQILGNAGIEAQGALLSFHCWRHTFRTRLAEAGVPAEVVRKLGGWTSDVAERYNHDTVSLRRAIEAI